MNNKPDDESAEACLQNIRSYVYAYPSKNSTSEGHRKEFGTIVGGVGLSFGPLSVCLLNGSRLTIGGTR